MNHFKILLSLAAISFLYEITFSNAYAYLDPGSGSLIIQMINGAAAGAGIAIKVYWVKIKEKFSIKLSRK